MMTFLFEHEEVGYEDLDKEIRLRRNYCKLNEARDNIVEIEKGLNGRPDTQRPITYFLYKGLTPKTLHDHLQRKRATNINIIHALRHLQEVQPDFAENYLCRNGRPHPFDKPFPDISNTSNNAIADGKMSLPKAEYYRLFYGSQEL